MTNVYLKNPNTTACPVLKNDDAEVGLIEKKRLCLEREAKERAEFDSSLQLLHDTWVAVRTKAECPCLKYGIL